MRGLRDGLSRWWPVLALLAVVVLFAFVFFGFPLLYVTDGDLPKAAQRLKAQNDVRGTRIQALGGFVALIGAYVAYRSWREDRFTKREERLRDLLAQLESEHHEIRVAAIDGLGRIATESRTYAERVARRSPTRSRRWRSATTPSGW
jgi:hypothetical protein